MLQRTWQGRSVTADELLEQISPADARRFMTPFLAILERKGYSTRRQ
jgi:hypothetical protein